MFKRMSLLLVFLASISLHSNSAEHFYHIQTNETGFERGVIMGAAMGQEINQRLKAWNRLVKAHFGLVGSELLEHLNAQKRWLEPIEVAHSIALEEIKGIAYAAGVPYAELLTYNLAEEIMTLASQSYESCTNIAKRSESGVDLAYNLDIPVFLHGNKKPFVISNSNGVFVLGFPGILATTVITPQFAVTTNSLPDLNSKNSGLPLPMALHFISTLNDASSVDQFLRNTSISVAQNFMMTDGKNIDNIESSANKHSFNRIEKARFFHTNFAQFNQDFFESDNTPKQCERYKALNEYFDSAPITSQSTSDIKEAIALTVDSETFLSLVVSYNDEHREPTVSIRTSNNEYFHSLQSATE